MKRMLVVSRSIPAHGDTGGMEQMAWDMAGHLADRWQVRVLTTPVPGRPQAFEEDGLQVVTVPGARPGRYGWRWWLGTARHDPDADVVLSVSSGATTMSLTHRRPAYVFQAHGTALSELEGMVRVRPRLWPLKAVRLAYWLLVDRFTYRRMGTVIAASEQVAKHLRRAPYRGVWRSAELVVIPNGVSVHDNRRIYERRPDIVAVTVSRLTRQKGVDRAIAALPHAGADVQLLIVGAGPEEAALRRQASDLGVSHRVQFAGHLMTEEVADALAAGDVFVFPARNVEREALPLSVLEALASGLPVIVPKGSAWPEDLTELLRFTAVDDPAELGKAITVPLVDGPRPSRLPSRYTSEAVAAQYDEIIRRWTS